MSAVKCDLCGSGRRVELLTDEDRDRFPELATRTTWCDTCRRRRPHRARWVDDATYSKLTKLRRRLTS